MDRDRRHIPVGRDAGRRRAGARCRAGAGQLAGRRAGRPVGPSVRRPAGQAGSAFFPSAAASAAAATCQASGRRTATKCLAATAYGLALAIPGQLAQCGAIGSAASTAATTAPQFERDAATGKASTAGIMAERRSAAPDGRAAPATAAASAAPAAASAAATSKGSIVATPPAQASAGG